MTTESHNEALMRCFYCSVTDDENILHLASTSTREKILEAIKVSNDETNYAKVGDFPSKDLRYHLICLSKFHKEVSRKSKEFFLCPGLFIIFVK